ncbi:MAG: hypothetical protein KJO13_07745, partial [Gammaproteobacteria bacterium]|nr:hypothetical protein [Gammaproteobacteria bacterium]
PLANEKIRTDIKGDKLANVRRGNNVAVVVDGQRPFNISNRHVEHNGIGALTFSQGNPVTIAASTGGQKNQYEC